MSDCFCRIEGDVGRVTLQRPDALNALTHDMALQIEAMIDAWRGVVRLVIIDAQGDRAFCAGGDIASLYDSAQAGDIAYGRTFWQDEYRLNAKLSEYPVPLVSFLQGFVMGGGVGLGCHVSHRIVCETSKIAMPECGIGLMPDVGGSLLLANAPGNLGEYLGMTGARMGPADAIFAGFADTFVPYEDWGELKRRLCETGDVSAVADCAKAPEPSTMKANIDAVNTYFRHGTAEEILAALKSSDADFAQRALKGLLRGAPLALACCHRTLTTLRGTTDLLAALAFEFRFTARAVEQGDFPEGIRAAIIDKDNAPKWAHETVSDVTSYEVDAMLADLEEDALDLEG